LSLVKDGLTVVADEVDPVWRYAESFERRQGRCSVDLVEADVELAPFRNRMPPDAYGRAQAACVDRLVRDRFSLPVVAFE